MTAHTFHGKTWDCGNPACEDAHHRRVSGGSGPLPRSETDERMAEAVAADAGLLLQAIRTAPWADAFARNVAAGQYERLIAVRAERDALHRQLAAVEAVSEHYGMVYRSTGLGTADFAVLADLRKALAAPVDVPREEEDAPTLEDADDQDVLLEAATRLRRMTGDPSDPTADAVTCLAFGERPDDPAVDVPQPTPTCEHDWTCSHTYTDPEFGAEMACPGPVTATKEAGK